VALENFTTSPPWNEVDTEGQVTVTANKVAIAGVSRASDNYVYRDGSVGEFEEYEIHFKVITTSTVGSPYYVPFAMANAVESFKDIDAAGGDGHCILWHYDGPMFRLFELIAGTLYSDDSAAPSVGTTYFFRVWRDWENDELWAYICTGDYDDAAIPGTTFDTLYLALGDSQQAFRYLYAYSSWKVGTGSAISADIENFEITVEAAPPTGYPYCQVIIFR